MSQAAPFKLTYSTMFAPPPELHARFDAALAGARSRLGRSHPMLIAGRPHPAAAQFELRSPIDRDWLIGRFQRGTAPDVDAAVAAARAAYKAWSDTPWPQRLAPLRRAAALIEERVYDIA
ncbi:MAG: aldehyde dehydrogenase family protein, partial [Burkholderiaceae bacterium]